MGAVADVTGAGQGAAQVVMAFLGCGGRRDFSGARALLDDRITRTGPDGDVKTGRDEYLAYLDRALGGARDYRYELRRCVVTEDGLTVLVEIDETLTEADGTRLAVSEAMIFDLTPELRILRLSVYTKT
jgi:hypothetical protein